MKQLLREKVREEIKATESIMINEEWHDVDSNDYWCHIIPCQYCHKSIFQEQSKGGEKR